jgi:hypothetical protein
VTGLAALVASLAGSVERTAIGGSAVAGDVTELAAGIALHRLRLAVSGEMVWSPALVASCWSGPASESAAARVSESAAGDRTTATHPNTGRIRAGSLYETCQRLVFMNRDNVVLTARCPG